MASYKRNNYKYVAGHYQKDLIDKPEGAVTIMEDRVKKIGVINVPFITNSAIGALAASTSINGAKRLFAPNTLPATKGDVDLLKKEITELKILIRMTK